MPVLVFDSAFARARRLALLDELTAVDERVTTRAVLEEIRVGLPQHPEELQDVLEFAMALSGGPGQPR